VHYNESNTVHRSGGGSNSGVSESAVKLAYKTANVFAPGYLQSEVEQLIAEMADRLEPFWADFTTSGTAGFGGYPVKRGDEVSEALLPCPTTTRSAGRSPPS
jgi:hypothetical protein